MRLSVTALGLLVLAGMAPALPSGLRMEYRARAMAESSDELVSYTVRQGDSLQSIAQRWFVNPADWTRAQTLNRISDPDNLVPGTVLSFRLSWLRFEPLAARIIFWQGHVEIISSGNRRTVTSQARLFEGDIIETGHDGLVTMSLPDSSMMSLPSNSRIRLSRLRHLGISNAIDRRFHLEQGRSEARVRPMANRQSTFVVDTPVSVAAVRGTHFRISYTPAELRATAEVIEGKVQVTPADSKLPGDSMLHAGFGAIAGPDGVSAPIALLGPPTVAEVGKVQSESSLHFRVEPLAGAVRYRLEIARDDQFLQMLATTEGPGPDFTFASISEGTYFLRATAIDVHGLEGLPAVATFDRVLPSPRGNWVTTKAQTSMVQVSSPRLPGGDAFLAAAGADGAAPPSASAASQGSQSSQGSESGNSSSSDEDSPQFTMPASWNSPGFNGLDGVDSGSNFGSGGWDGLPGGPGTPLPPGGGGGPVPPGPGTTPDLPPPTVMVPEPESWALLILGFGLVGLRLRRHRKAANTNLDCVNYSERSE